MPITEAWLKANHGKERDKVEEAPDRDSMSVRVSAKGKIVYQLRYRFDGKPHRLDIGSYPLMTLKDARNENQRLRGMLEQGLNPKVERLVERQVHVRPDTLEDLFSKWYESYCIENKQSHDQIKRSFEIHVFNHIGQLPVARITLQQWLNILEPLSKKHPGIGLRVLINAKQMLKWAVKRQMIPVNVLAEMLAKEDFNIQKNVTTRTLTDEEIKLLWLAVDGSRMMHKNKLFIKLCLVYGCRNGELRIAEKKHFDFEKMVWTVPPENHKTGRVTKRPIIRPILPYTEQLIKEAMNLNEGQYLFMNDDGLNVMSRSSPLNQTTPDSLHMQAFLLPRGKTMAEYLSPEDLEAAHANVATLGEVVNGDNQTMVESPNGEVYPSLAKALYTVIQSGGFEPFVTEAALIASVPAVPKKAAYAVDTLKVWYWNGSAWVDTGLSELDRAKAYADANPLFKPAILTTGQDVLTLAEGRYRIPSIAVGDSLLNMPTAPYKYGYIDVGLSGGTTQYKVIRFFPYGRDTNFYTNSSYEAGVWSGWGTFSSLAALTALFATKSELSSGIAASLDNVTQSAFFGKQFIDTELTGTKLYTAGRYVGFNGVTTAAVSFNAITGRVFNADSGNVEYRIYTGTALSSGVNGYGVANGKVGNYSYSGICKSFPKSDTGSAQTITLDKVITLPASTPFVIVFKNVNLATFGIAAHASVSGNLDSRSFVLSTSNVDWGSLTQIGNAAVSNAYVQTGFQLIIALSVASSSSSASYSPVLVLPPKIYCLAGLESHVYPEHILPESADLYLHDVTCTRGNQMKRGWVYTPLTTQAAGNIAFSWAIADRQSGKTVNTASSLLVVAPQTTSGTKNLMVIGDSLVNAGHITQRLLDIASTDPLKLTLIGTRGTGLNKHEGRGGWTIDDYTTVGRTYYQFTVSGVTTTPALNSATYTYGGSTFLVQETSLSGGAGTITCSLSSGSAPSNGASGTLTKYNGSAGDATIGFSSVQSQSGNPFWISGAINFSQYLSNNSLNTPDIVLIQLGVNDVFSLTADTDVDAAALTAFTKLDVLVNSIKSANASIKIGIVASPTGADQDAFGLNYGCGQTTWRYKRNLVTFHKAMYARYGGREAESLYVVGSGVNVDTFNNFTTTTQVVNSQNSNTVVVQNNGVHPADTGYKQIADAIFPFLKAI